MDNIQINVAENLATKTSSPLITQGMVGLTCKFTFDNYWNQFDSIVAIVKGSNRKNNYFVADDTIEIDQQFLLEPGGMLLVGLCGALSDGTIITPTIWTRCGRIEDSTWDCRDLSGVHHVPTVWDDLNTRMNNVEGVARRLDEMTVSANTLEPGDDAEVEKTVGQEGEVHFTFGIPKGGQGDTGNGIESVTLNDDYTLTINFTNGESFTTGSIRGEQGDTGNGILSVSKSGTSGNVDTYTITFTDGTTTTFTVTNGSVTSVNGQTGAITGLATQDEMQQADSQLSESIAVLSNFVSAFGLSVVGEKICMEVSNG